MNSWGKRGAGELYGVIKASMPMGNANSLSPETYQQIVAFIFQANGAAPGSAAFKGTAKTPIASFATGDSRSRTELEMCIARIPSGRRWPR